MNALKRQVMHDRIAAHGKDLITLFKLPRTTNPIALCKSLRRIERKAADIGLRLCNGPEYTTSEYEAAQDKVFNSLRKLLGRKECTIIHINQDPRGYALKIDEYVMRSNNINLYTDFGGYGIIAPDFNHYS